MNKEILQNDFVLSLKELILSQAKYFLKDADEFFPFGAYIDKNGKNVPTAVYDGEEHPPSQKVIDNLTEAYKQHIHKYGYLGIGTGVDVRVVSPGIGKKMDAIEIRIDVKDVGCVNFYIPYEKTENEEYKFYEEYYDVGTLSLF